MNNNSCLDCWYLCYDNLYKKIQITSAYFMSLFNNEELSYHRYSPVRVIETKVIKKDVELYERNKVIEYNTPSLISVQEVKSDDYDDYEIV